MILAMYNLWNFFYVLLEILPWILGIGLASAFLTLAIMKALEYLRL